MNLLWQLSAELPRFRASIAGARIISTYPRAAEARHPILAFAFNRVPAAVIESQLLRLSEAIDPLLNRASIQFLGVGLGRISGREWIPNDPDFALLLRLRHYRVAHLVKLRTLADEAYEELMGRYTSALDFLDVVLTKIEDLLADLEAAGLFEPREGLTASIGIEPTFSARELDELVRAAEQLNTSIR